MTLDIIVHELVLRSGFFQSVFQRTLWYRCPANLTPVNFLRRIQFSEAWKRGCGGDELVGGVFSWLAEH